MIVLFMITYTMMSDVVEGAGTDEDGSAIEELDEKPRISIYELFKYKVSRSPVDVLVWTRLRLSQLDSLCSLGTNIK